MMAEYRLRGIVISEKRLRRRLSELVIDGIMQCKAIRICDEQGRVTLARVWWEMEK